MARAPFATNWSMRWAVPDEWRMEQVNRSSPIKLGELNEGCENLGERACHLGHAGRTRLGAWRLVRYQDPRRRAGQEPNAGRAVDQRRRGTQCADGRRRRKRARQCENKT